MLPEFHEANRERTPTHTYRRHGLHPRVHSRAGLGFDFASHHEELYSLGSQCHHMLLGLEALRRLVESRQFGGCHDGQARVIEKYF